MEGYPLIYRSAVVVKPRQAFLDWLNGIDPADNPSLSELREDCRVYLVPDFEDAPDIEKAIDKYVRNNFMGIFVNELEAWYTDPDKFPELTYKKFEEWFEITTHSMIFDTVDKPISKEED